MAVNQPVPLFPVLSIRGNAALISGRAAVAAVASRLCVCAGLVGFRSAYAVVPPIEYQLPALSV